MTLAPAPLPTESRGRGRGRVLALLLLVVSPVCAEYLQAYDPTTTGNAVCAALRACWCWDRCTGHPPC